MYYFLRGHICTITSVLIEKKCAYISTIFWYDVIFWSDNRTNNANIEAKGHFLDWMLSGFFYK